MSRAADVRSEHDGAVASRAASSNAIEEAP
jgi:hypothetical protein